MESRSLATPELAPSPRATLAARVLIAAGIVLVAFSLRVGVLSQGALLADVRDGLGISSTLAGLLTALPALCFALFGSLTPPLGRRFGNERVTLVTTAATAAGLALRGVAGDGAGFLAASALAFAGAAASNVLLPALVKRWFAGRVPLLTAVYTTTMLIGSAIVAAVAVPVADALGGWRGGVAIWAAPALLATLPWLTTLGRSGRDNAARAQAGAAEHIGAPEPAARAPTFTELRRLLMPWAFVVFFGTQSVGAYVMFGWLAQISQDAGFSASAAGLILALSTTMSIPASFVLLTIAGRMRDQRRLIVPLVACSVVAFVGLALAPGLAYVWSALFGIGGTTFSLSLVLVGLRTRRHELTAALSGFMQGIGYVIAALGPLGVGALHGATGGWRVPLLVVAVVVALQIPSGLIVARERMLDDHLAGHG